MFLKKICSEFDVPPQRTLLAQLDAVEEFLAQNHSEGRTAIIIVDEAQLLSLERLEMVLLAAMIGFRLDYWGVPTCSSTDRSRTSMK